MASNIPSQFADARVKSGLRPPCRFIISMVPTSTDPLVLPARDIWQETPPPTKQTQHTCTPSCAMHSGTRSSWKTARHSPTQGSARPGSKVSVSLFGTTAVSEAGSRSWWSRLATSCSGATYGLLGTAVVSAAAAVGSIRMGATTSAAVLSLCGAVATGLAAAGWGYRPLTPVSYDVELEAAFLFEVEGQVEVDGKVAETSPAADELSAYAKPIREWFVAAWLRFGVLEDTSADRRTVHRWLADEMKAADVRNTDAFGWIPVIVEMMFVPTVGQIYASHIGRSGTAHVLRSMLRQERA